VYHQLIGRQWKYGFSYVDGCPPTTSATQSLLERISFIRPTHYGMQTLQLFSWTKCSNHEIGGFWDFTSDLSSKDTAYTNLALKAHTDTTYFTDPVRLQMFHLLSHTEGEGGASLLVDGFRAAARLRQKFPKAYKILSDHGIPCHSNGNPGMSLRPAQLFPVLNHHPGNKAVNQVRWNNDDRGTMPSCGVDSDVWYNAARKWMKILQSPESEYWEQLKPGRPLSMY